MILGMFCTCVTCMIVDVSKGDTFTWHNKNERMANIQT